LFILSRVWVGKLGGVVVVALQEISDVGQEPAHIEKKCVVAEMRTTRVQTDIFAMCWIESRVEKEVSTRNGEVHLEDSP